MPKLRVHGVRFLPDAKLRVHSVRFNGDAPLSLQPISDQTVEGLSTVTLHVIPASSSSTPASYHWTQKSGPTVTFADGGDTITFTAPADLNGTAVTFGVVAVLGPQTSTEVTGLVNVKPWIDWALGSDMVWHPRMRIQKL